MLRIHSDNPADAVEEAYFRIYRERMADVPVHNEALSVAAVDFQKWQGHWLGVVVTSWCMSVLLIPGKAEGWEMPGDNQRRFIKFPAGDFAFLGSDEPELGQFQSCALFSPMNQFASQAEAEQTARAALGVLLAPPVPKAETTAVTTTAESVPAPETKAEDESVSLSRRRLFGLGGRK